MFGMLKTKVATIITERQHVSDREIQCHIDTECHDGGRKCHARSRVTPVRREKGEQKFTAV